MITLKIEYWDRLRETKRTKSGMLYECQDSSKVREEDLTAETEDALFVKFYKLNNRLRYCNGSYYKFVNPKDQARYNEWNKNLSQGRSFNLYYGNGIVD